MKLVDDWRRAWRWSSVQLSAVGAVVMGAAEIAGSSWSALPPDVRDNIPHAQTIALVLFVLLPIARIFTKGGKDDGE
jgi:hypothetical protein